MLLLATIKTEHPNKQTCPKHVAKDVKPQYAWGSCMAIGDELHWKIVSRE